MESNPYRRAAIVVASLDRQSADEILERLPEEQARTIRDEIVLLDEFSPNEQEAAVNEFLCERQGMQRGEEAVFSFNVPAASPGTASPPRPVPATSLDDLLEQNDGLIAQAVMHERTSVVAALLAALPGKRAAAVLRLLPVDLQSRAAAALNLGVRLNHAAFDVIADQICDQQAELESDGSLGMHHRDALQAIFDELTVEEQAEMLQDLSKENPLLAARLTSKKARANDCY